MKITDTQGRRIDLAESFLETGMFGDGADGAADFDGTGTPAGAVLDNNNPAIYVLLRSVFYTDMRVHDDVLVKTAGFRIFCTGTLTNEGRIAHDGTMASGSSGGATLPPEELGGGSGGGNGGAGSSTDGADGASGAAAAYSMGGSGGDGGAGGGSSGFSGGGGASGAGITPRPFRALNHHLLAGVNLITGGAGGSGGGGGGGDNTNEGADGGAGGSGGGVVMIFTARIINHAGLITALGATGGDGGDAPTGSAGGGGAGGGGGGGVVYLAYNHFAGAANTVGATGGPPGTPGSPSGAGSGGAAGTTGQDGTILRYNGIYKRWES